MINLQLHRKEQDCVCQRPWVLTVMDPRKYYLYREIIEKKLSTPVHEEIQEQHRVYRNTVLSETEK